MRKLLRQETRDMHNMHAKIAKYTLIALIPIVLILGNFRLLAFNKEFYYNEIDKNHVNLENAREQTAEIIDYLKTGETINNKLVSNDELTHLKDVRKLIKNSLIILYLASALAACALLLLILKQRLALSSIYYGGIATAAIVGLLLFILTFTFDQAFFIFHKLLFRNNLWLLPPESTLIRLLPQQFFIDFAKRLGLNTMIMSFLLIFIGRIKR